MVSWDSISMPNSKENNTFWIKMAAWFSKINLILNFYFFFTFKLTLTCIYKGCEFFHLIQQDEAILHTEPDIFNRGGQTDSSLNISLSKCNFFWGGHLLLFGYRLLLCKTLLATVFKMAGQHKLHIFIHLDFICLALNHKNSHLKAPL